MSGHTNNPPAVQITLREIYDQLVCMRSAVERLVSLADTVDDHEGRLRIMERRVWSIPSASLLISLAAVGIQLWR